MAQILVTGGTGTLGQSLVPQFLDRGHDVRVLTRRTSDLPMGISTIRGDLVNGENVDDAFNGVDVVVHAATDPTRNAQSFETNSMTTIIRAAQRTGAHVVYVSIVGVDRNRYGYYKAKRSAEKLLEESNVKWTIQRATQFHDLIDRFLQGRAFVRAPGLAFQPIDVAEVAGRLVEIAENEPIGRATDLGGPELLGIKTLARRREAITNHHTRLIKVPRVGMVKDFVRGAHLCPRHRDGVITWEQWITNRYQ